MHALPQSVPPALQQATADPRLCQSPGPSQASLGHGVTAPFSWVLVHKMLCLCLPKVYCPVLCKFWQLCGGVNGNLLLKGLWHTQVCCIQSPCPCGRPLLTHTSAGDNQTLKGRSGSVSVGSPGVHRSCLSPRVSLAGIGFDSNCDFAPPTIILGLLFCPWTWDIFFSGIQHPPVDGCSAASCYSGVLTGEDEHTSFCSTTL